jgi:RNA polymerase sigma factor (sigma-70 family)
LDLTTVLLSETRRENLSMDKQLRNAIKGILDTDLERRRRSMEPFVRCTFDRFSRCLYRYLGNEVECEDVLEDVYADIWENPEKLRSVSTEKELVRTVYLYYMRKRLRQVYRRLNRHLSLSQECLATLAAPNMGLLEQASDEELKLILKKGMTKLKARERRAIELWAEGMSNRAIAGELNTTVGAVKMLLYRTLLKLRKMLSHYVSDEH